MTLKELIKKNINRDLGYWKIEEYVWLHILENGEISFRYGGCTLRANNNYEALNLNCDEDDRNAMLHVDQEHLDDASNYLFSLKLDDQLKALVKCSKRGVKI